MMVIRTASEVGLPPSVKAQMVLNVIADFVIGLIPFLGDILDIAFKANTRNAIVLEEYLRQRGAENIRKQGLPPQQDPSLGEVYDEHVVSQQQPQQPPPSYRSPGMRGGWFGGPGRTEYDVEAQRPSGSGNGSGSGPAPRRESERHGTGRVSKHKSSKHGSSSRGSSGRGTSRHESSRHKSKSSRDQGGRSREQESRR